MRSGGSQKTVSCKKSQKYYFIIFYYQKKYPYYPEPHKYWARDLCDYKILSEIRKGSLLQLPYFIIS